MAFPELFLLALALALDAFAVAVGAGCALRQVRLYHYLRIGGAFGFFQFMMPVAGWFLGSTVRHFIESWAHWLAFALLTWIGSNMIRSSLGRSVDCPVSDPTAGRNLLILAIATSIDALATGLSFSLLAIPVWKPSILIGVVCALMSGCGLFLGKTLAGAPLFSKRAELVGGGVLIAIGIRILFEHGAFDGI